MPAASPTEGADAAATTSLIRLLAGEGRGDEAHAVWRRLESRATGSATLALELAKLAETQHRAAAAEECYRRALTLRPEWSWIERPLARLLAAGHRFAEAEALVERQRAAAPGDLETWRLAADIAGRRDLPAERLLHLGRALALAEDTAALRLELALAHAGLHRAALADRILEDHLAAWPADFTASCRYAEVAELCHDPYLAEQRWAAAARVAPDRVEPGLGLARAAERCGRFAAAERICLDLASAHPEHPLVLRQTARLLLAQARREEARSWLDRALALQPDHPTPRLLLVRLLAESDQPTPARRAAEATAERFPERPDVRVLTAYVDHMAGRARRAEVGFRAVTDAFPDSHWASLRLAEHREQRGDPAGARAAVEEGLARGQQALALRLRAVDLAFALGDRAAALAHLDPLVDAYPQHRDVRKRLARAELAAGRVEVARRLWAGCATAEPAVSGGRPVGMARLDANPIPDGSGEVRLFAKLRNERSRLPWLLDFYRGQGVDRFVLVDNLSDDGTRDHLLAQGDVHLFVTAEALDEAAGGTRWYNHLLGLHGCGHWCLTVDADEVFAYPGAERLGLKGLAAWLDGQGAEGMQAFMLDLYPDTPVADLEAAPGESPFVSCPFFDRDGYIILDRPDFPFRTVWGGVAARVLHRGRALGPMLQKVPLVRWRPDLRYLSNAHHLYPVRLAEETAVLLHFKYLNGFAGRVRAEAARRRYWAGGRVYAELMRRVIDPGADTFVHPGSAEFRSTRQLVELGLMASTPAFDRFLAARATAAAPLPGWPT